ncbi:hypothetical protein Tco_0804826 [Tanacetum coccineum]|uniref:Uncharacterized protein n=1 Tax=Tanacetum coccineum TaxID=301880 RepID=A0ABQ5A754_9ASTR
MVTNPKSLPSWFSLLFQNPHGANSPKHSIEEITSIKTEENNFNQGTCKTKGQKPAIPNGKFNTDMLQNLLLLKQLLLPVLEPLPGPKAFNHDTEVTKDKMPPANNGSTEDVQPPVVQIQSRNPNPHPESQYLPPVNLALPELTPTRMTFRASRSYQSLKPNRYCYTRRPSNGGKFPISPADFVMIMEEDHPSLAKEAITIQPGPDFKNTQLIYDHMTANKIDSHRNGFMSILKSPLVSIPWALRLKGTFTRGTNSLPGSIMTTSVHTKIALPSSLSNLSHSCENQTAQFSLFFLAEVEQSDVPSNSLTPLRQTLDFTQRLRLLS